MAAGSARRVGFDTLGIQRNTAVLTPDASGRMTAPFSSFGIDARPRALLLTPQSFNGYMRYDWDASEYEVVLYAFGTNGSPYTSVLRFGYIVIV